MCEDGWRKIGDRRFVSCRSATSPLLLAEKSTMEIPNHDLATLAPRVGWCSYWPQARRRPVESKLIELHSQGSRYMKSSGFCVRKPGGCPVPDRGQMSAVGRERNAAGSDELAVDLTSSSPLSVFQRLGHPHSGLPRLAFLSGAMATLRTGAPVVRLCSSSCRSTSHMRTPTFPPSTAGAIAMTFPCQAMH